jgi:protein SCO1/2
MVDRRYGQLRRMWQGMRLLLCVAMGLIVSTLTACSPTDSSAVPAFRGLNVTGAIFGQDLRLTDADGHERRLGDFRGKAVMLYFGFVQCPDVCPTALSRAVEAKRLLGAAGERLQVVFVTVDPERDTPEILKSYMAAFDPGFVALYGNAERTRQTADSFKAYYRKVPTGSSYTMDHSAMSYVFDAEGKLRVVLQHAQTAGDYAHDIALVLQIPPPL